MKHAPTRSPQSVTPFMPAMQTPEGVLPRAEGSLAGRSELACRLPPRMHWAEEQSSPSVSALAMLVSACCYLSLSPEGTTESLLEAAKLCHDLGATLGLEWDPTDASREDLEETLWLTKQSKWERHYCLETAIRFVLSPQPARQTPARRKRLTEWTGWLTRLRRPHAVPPF